MREFLEKMVAAYGDQIHLVVEAPIVPDGHVVEAMERCMFYLWALENLDA